MISRQARITKAFFHNILHNPYIPHKPFRQQAIFLTLEDEEAFYGGQAGGGKSDALLMAALEYVRFPQYRAILLRKSLKELKKSGALIERSHKWLDSTDAHWHEQDSYWQFPSGAKLEFGYLSNSADLDQYDSAEYHFMGYDELTSFTEYLYVTASGRIRKNEGDPIPLRLRGASNPGKIGHKWVKDRFIKGPYKFIPSTYKQNKYINQEAYERTLMKLPYVQRKQKMDGDWDIGSEGGLYNRLWFKLVDAVSYDDIEKVVRYWDFAATEFTGDNDPDWTVGCLGIKYSNQRMLVADVKRVRWSPFKVDELLTRTTREDYNLFKNKLGIPYDVWLEQEGGAGSKRDNNAIMRMLSGYPVRSDPVRKSKEDRASSSSSYAEAGNVDVLDTGWTNEFLEELDFFPDNVEHDDQVDGFSGAFNKLFPVVGNATPKIKIIQM
jgi:predicted phage terminase large subunit-like protein